MMRTIFAILLVTVLVLSLSTVALAANPSATAEQMAAELKAWGLFKGVSETDFDLYRAPTRAEALVMLIRSEGKESEALAGGCEHPFTDVPAWADSYVGYAYVNGLTNGISATLFGASNAAGANVYLTFMLRALGYDDTQGDFTWEAPFALAEAAGILPSSVDLENFWRRDAVVVSYAALHSTMKDGSGTLGESLGIDLSVHPVAALRAEAQALADYFGVDLYIVTAMVDAVNDALADNGFPENYTLSGVSDRIKSGELKRYLGSAGTPTDSFGNFAYDETLSALQSRKQSA
jgi:hypothetical protein